MSIACNQNNCFWVLCPCINVQVSTGSQVCVPQKMFFSRKIDLLVDQFMGLSSFWNLPPLHENSFEDTWLIPCALKITVNTRNNRQTSSVICLYVFVCLFLLTLHLLLGMESDNGDKNGKRVVWELAPVQAFKLETKIYKSNVTRCSDWVLNLVFHNMGSTQIKSICEQGSEANNWT